MSEALIITTAIAVLLFVGVVCSWIGKKLKIPDILLLILAGLLLGRVELNGEALIKFPEVFLSSLAILALAMVVFDSTTRLRLRDLDTFSLKAIRLTFIFSALTLLLFSATASLILKIPFTTSLLFASIMIGTSPEAVLAFGGKSKALTMLKLESIFNTPLTVILPFLILDLMQTENITTNLIEQLQPLIMKFIVGIGAGVFCAIILFKLVQKAYTEVYSPLAVIVAALLSYVLAENLGGSGVLSVTSLGLFFGNVYVKEKVALMSAEGVVAKALYILIFMLTGLIIRIPYTKEFLITSSILFLTYISIRFISVWISLHGEKYTISDLLYMSLNSPKGIATAAVVFSLLVYAIDGMNIILDMTFAFILYSIIISSIASWIWRHHASSN
ncbi:hypothetical protein D6825_02685 [Candidatus Woesearchaeota archaeon]|nr:MAG: hypothetical protein D6825_02685 [Candidatus Woesearchaeota archaeon]